MTREEIKDYQDFMYDPENIERCDCCPENRGFSSWPGHRLPCGQDNCWVVVHCKSQETTA